LKIEIVLEATGASRSLAEYKGEEGFTTRVKVVDFSKSRRDLKHDPKVDIYDGIRRYVAWARKVYEI
jgi:dTDP-glucose 4,6-dehydratase